MRKLGTGCINGSQLDSNPIRFPVKTAGHGPVRSLHDRHDVTLRTEIGAKIKIEGLKLENLKR